MKFRLPILVLIFFLSGCTDSDEKRNQMETASRELAEAGNAFSILQVAEELRGSAVGFGGTASKEACAMLTLLESNDPNYWFKKLLEESTLAGRLYGLMGHCHVDPFNCIGAAETLALNTDYVSLQSGCTTIPYEVSELVYMIKLEGLLLYSKTKDRCEHFAL